jgi:hypothetical protein
MGGHPVSGVATCRGSGLRPSSDPLDTPSCTPVRPRTQEKDVKKRRVNFGIAEECFAVSLELVLLRLHCGMKGVRFETKLKHQKYELLDHKVKKLQYGLKEVCFETKSKHQKYEL